MKAYQSALGKKLLSTLEGRDALRRWVERGCRAAVVTIGDARYVLRLAHDRTAAEIGKALAGEREGR